MSPIQVQEVFQKFNESNPQLTENEKRVLDYFQELLLGLIPSITIVCDQESPPVFKHIADRVFPEISLNYLSREGVLVLREDKKGFLVNLNDFEALTVENIINRTKNLLINGR